MLAFDSSAPQFGVDGLLVVLIAVNAFLGWKSGFLRRVIAFIGLYVGIIAAYYAGDGIADWINKNSIVTRAWTFIGIVLVCVVAAEVVGRLLADRVRRLATLVFDHSAGLVAGAAVGFFQALTVFWVALAVGAAPATATNNVPTDHGTYASAVESATLSSRSVNALPALQTIVKPAVGDDLTDHLLNGSTIGPS